MKMLLQTVKNVSGSAGGLREVDAFRYRQALVASATAQYSA